MLNVVVPVAVIGFIAVYYLLYFKRIRAAGGMAAAGEIYWREQFGLWPHERVVAMWVGSYYMGKLVPSSMRTTGQEVLDLITSTSVRGAGVYFCFTDHQRMAMAVELDGGDTGPRSSVGMAYGYRPAAAYSAEQRPHIAPACEVFPGSPDLPRASERPRQRNLQNEPCTMRLIVLTDTAGTRSTLWVDEAWVGQMLAWCRGGPVTVEPRFAQPARAHSH